jgi:hypothetical protein
VAFLKVDLDIALTFAEIALHAGDDFEKKFRNQTNALYAYDTVLRLSERVTFTQADALQIENGLKRLKATLEQLGALPRPVRIRQKVA